MADEAGHHGRDLVHTVADVGSCAFLPLHAAGRYADGGHGNVLDRVMSSYTTTIRAFYRHLARPGANVPAPAVAATVLHRSVREHRALHLGLPTQWAAHIHHGPLMEGIHMVEAPRSSAAGQRAPRAGVARMIRYRSTTQASSSEAAHLTCLTWLKPLDIGKANTLTPYLADMADY